MGGNKLLKNLLYTFILCTCFLTACGEVEEPIVEEEVPQKSTSETNTDTVVPEVGQVLNIQREVKEFPSLNGIPVDFDLTDMSTTVSFSIAYMMMYDPEEYWDKSYRLQGVYFYQYYEQFGDVHALLILDETNCCQAAIEFILPEGEEYPPNGSEIGLIGEYIFIDDPVVPYSVLKTSHIAF